MRAAALAGAGPQTSGCRRACPAGCARISSPTCHSEQGYRCFAALNMTVAAALRKEVNDKRSAVKNLSMYTFIQILRRSAPQNDNAVIPYWLRYGMPSKILARAGCGGRISDASRPGRKVFRIRRRTEPAGHACHNCHSERSEESILGKVTDSSSLCSSE